MLVKAAGTRAGSTPRGRHEGRAMARAYHLAAHEVSLPLLRLSTPQNERRDHAEETRDVKEVPSERNELRADQPNVTGASDKEIGSAANREGACQIKKEK